MLVELRVTNLGVIEDQTILLGPGLTALTGETGAGKTLLVDAISLLTGAPSDPSLVAPGADQAVIEGRFEGGPAGLPAPGAEAGSPGSHPEVTPGTDVVLTRVIPAGGRSRCYIDGRMASLSQLGAIGRALVDIHGQHAHQSLLSPSAQRDALDSAAGIDTSEVSTWRRRVRELTVARDDLGGDPRARARQLDLLTYQLHEIDSADLDDPSEDRRLMEEEELLADAGGLAETAGAAWEALAGDSGVVERLGRVVSATAGRRPLAELHGRLSALQEELTDAAAEARRLGESVEDDPPRLAAIGERRRCLTELRRKYGGTLDEVIAYREELRRQVDELASHDLKAAEVEAELDRAAKELTVSLERLWEARRAAAPRLARAVEGRLRELAMPRARFDIEVGPDPSSEAVTWMLAPNPGQPLLPLAKVASGGELSRAMLATRLVMGPAGAGPGAAAPGPGAAGAGPGAAGAGPAAAPPAPGPVTLVFDEVDAGIGGEAAIAVGAALSALGQDRQVLVVTHLAQVAAFAATQFNVAKRVLGGPGAGPEIGAGTGPGAGERTVATATPLSGEARVVELARMLSGRPDSESARRHAEELLAAAEAETLAVHGNSAAPSPKSARRRR